MTKVWFKRKVYGWGWTPSSWEGWLVLFVYFYYVISKFREIDAFSHSGSDTLISFAVPFIISTCILIGICYETGEHPRWQWGRKKD